MRPFFSRRFPVLLLLGTAVGLVLLPGCNAFSDNDAMPSTKSLTIPLGGNAYRTSGAAPDEVTQEGITTWQNRESTFSVFVKIEEPASVTMRLRARVPDEQESTVRLSTGDYEQTATISNSDYEVVTVGETRIEETGYVRFDLEGVETSGDTFAHVSDLVLSVPSETPVQYVRSNENNNFYWSRRGPSVHLNYSLPEENNFEWLYSEITVPEGSDPVGSYFMANGFAHGYFGIQVNSPDERRVLFSIWSPHETDDPSTIPDAERVRLVEKGENVTAGTFGGEGAGGQSYLTYSWTAGQTYRFLTRARPDEDGNTVYSAYFYPPQEGEWRLIAKFRRPLTDSWMTGWYSFLENFIDRNGYKERKAYYHNQWARTTEGTWHEVRRATFTGDRVANEQTREDFAGGVDEGAFYLRNGGYFDDFVSLDQDFSYTGSSDEPPAIPFDRLP